MTHVFGPVPSRRLGYSLGVDIVPRKTCTLDCVYCQVGPTIEKTIERKQWVDPDHAFDDLVRALSRGEQIDYITFSGSGEPTLNTSLGVLLRKIKQISSIPVAVLTNGTLLYLPDVRRDLRGADLVVPSLDAVTPKVFDRLNCPHAELDVAKIIEGIKTFRKEFQGSLWLEVMIVKGVNDNRQELERIATVAQSIRPDKIQINSVSRPAALHGIEPASPEVFRLALKLFGKPAELIDEFNKHSISDSLEETGQRILQLVKRRPCSIAQIRQSLGITEAEIEKRILNMLCEGKIQEIRHEGKKFYKGL